MTSTRSAFPKSSTGSVSTASLSASSSSTHHRRHGRRPCPGHHHGDDHRDGRAHHRSHPAPSSCPNHGDPQSAEQKSSRSSRPGAPRRTTCNYGFCAAPIPVPASCDLAAIRPFIGFGVSCVCQFRTRAGALSSDRTEPTPAEIEIRRAEGAKGWLRLLDRKDRCFSIEPKSLGLVLQLRRRRRANLAQPTRAIPPNHPAQQHHDRQHKQNVNESTHRVGSRQSSDPQS